MTDMFAGNPAFTNTPTTPPGLAGIPYIAGGIVGPLIGQGVSPYVGPNQSTYDAYQALAVNTMYKEMLGRVYSQLGRQVGNSIAGMNGAINWLSSMTGYDPNRMRREINGMGENLGRGMIGSLVMPLLDSGLSSATGGGFVNAFNTLANNRMALGTSTALLNPFDAAQQHAAMSDAAAMMNMVNRVVSGDRVVNGKFTLLPDNAVLQGFDRDRVAGLAARMAGAGAFSSKYGGFGDTLRAISETKYIENLDYMRGDMDGGGDDSRYIPGTVRANRMRDYTRNFANKLKSGIDAMAAMRDMLKTVDGLEDKITEITNGDWLRSGTAARDTAHNIRKLNAVMQLYNLDPEQAWSNLMTNRGLLQEAAGFDENLRMFGFDGGGMFRLPAQTEMLANIEDVITSRGARYDPIKADRIRKQGMQNMARNMNTQAGIAAQLLAYAKQQGVVSADAANRLAERLISGDRSVMGSAIDQLLVTVFGSRQIGREFMQDSMQVQAMQQAMSDSAGKEAMHTIMRGANHEFLQRERLTVAQMRLNYSQDALKSLGMSTAQTPAGVALQVQSIATTLRNHKATGAAEAFVGMFEGYKNQGVGDIAALEMAQQEFKKNPSTAKYAGMMNLAAVNQAAENNEYWFEQHGAKGASAKARIDHLYRVGAVDADARRKVYDYIQDGDSDKAFQYVNSLTASRSSIFEAAGESNIDDRILDFNEQIGRWAYEEADKRIRKAKSRKEVAKLISTAGENGAGAADASDSFNAVVEALKRFRDSGKDTFSQENLRDALYQSRFREIYGDEAFEELLFLSYPRGAKVDPETGKWVHNAELLDSTIAKMGEQSTMLREAAVNNLHSTSWGLGAWGAYGGGKSRLSDAERYADTARLIRDTAQKMDDDSDYSAKDRDTFAQTLLSMAVGTDSAKALLRLYDRDGKYATVTKAYVEAIKKQDSAAKAYTREEEKALETAEKLLINGGHSEAADELRERVNDLGKYSDADIRATIQKGKGDITAETLEAAMEAVRKRRALFDAENNVSVEREKAASNEDFLPAAKAVQINMDADSVRKERALAGVLDLSRVDAANLKANSKAYKIRNRAIGVIDTDELKAYFTALGGSDDLDDYSPQAKVKAYADILNRRIAAGDERAIEAGKEMAAIMDEGATRIRGELTIRSGNQQAPGVIEGTMSTM